MNNKILRQVRRKMLEKEFKLVSEYTPRGDQPQAIEKLTEGILKGKKHQTLLGVTGSGKTFTMANVIQNVQKPTLVIAHNKTLAAQLYMEFKEFFPENCVEYFVSYYDYYQPEAYIPATDTYIEKDSSINDEIDKLRHSATAALFERRDVIIVASVSCIYGLGDPEDYTTLMQSLRVGMTYDRDQIIRKLIDIQYTRNEIDFKRGTFRVRGDVLEIFPASSSGEVIRVEFFGDEIDKICMIDYLTGEILGTTNHAAIFPASHYSTTSWKMERAIDGVDIKDMTKQELRRLVGMVRQDVFMFSGSILHNITLGNEDITFDRVQEAAVLTNAHEFIKDLPGQYDFQLNEGGSILSEGQRQLISFARAIVTDPKILVLDEATSNIDSETERLIQDALVKLMRNRSSISIAHRLSTIQNSDKIIVLNNGRIMEQGTHDELFEMRGLYYDLYNLQFE
jgi:ABC-type phosphate transport system ATPase subunit